MLYICVSKIIMMKATQVSTRYIYIIYIYIYIREREREREREQLPSIVTFTM